MSEFEAMSHESHGVCFCGPGHCDGGPDCEGECPDELGPDCGLQQVGDLAILCIRSEGHDGPHEWMISRRLADIPKLDNVTSIRGRR